jgi:hypothetical protein
MQKLLFGILLLAGATFTLQAQDVIIRENGEEIQAKVVEVGTDEIKYKKFGNESGPTYTISKSELFLIKYANGTKEVIEKSTAPVTAPAPVQQSYTAPAPVSQPVQTSSFSSSSSSSDDDYEKNDFALDLGIGSRDMEKVDWGTFADLGFRFLHNYSPYLGWDIFNVKIQGNTEYLSDIDEYLFQLMSGIRGHSPTFFKNMKGYGSLKFGLGYQPYLESAGFAYEFEIGLHLNKTVFLGFVYNSQYLKGTVYDGSYSYDFDATCPYAGVRIGFSF